MRIKLLADQWDQLTDGGYLRHFVGAVVDVSDSDGRRLVKCGAAVPENEATKVTASDSAAEGDAVVQDHDEVQDADESAQGEASSWKRPPKSGKLEAWQAYAAHLGLEVKGLRREEIIAAVAKIED